MHIQHNRILHGLIFMAAISIPSTLADEITTTAADIPGPCQTICAPIVKLMTTCKVDMSNMQMGNMNVDMSAEENKVETDCICNNKSFDVKSVMALCSSCMAQNGASANSSGSDKAAAAEDSVFFSNFVMSNDMSNIMSQCSIPTTSYAPSATSVLAGVQVQVTQPVISMSAGSEPQKAGAGRLKPSGGRLFAGVVISSLALGATFVMGML